MSIKKVDTTKANVWNNRTFFPKDNYILRCISEKVAPNSNGNPMVTLEWEIVNQEPKRIGADLFEFDGIKVTSYSVLRVMEGEDAEDKSNNCFRQYQERFLIPCGIDVSEGWDDENPPSLKGKVVYAGCYGKEQPSYKTPTDEQKAQGKKVGDILKDPITGKDVITYVPQIERIYGLFDGEVSRPY